jgi:hypothetical protein
MTVIVNDLVQDLIDIGFDLTQVKAALEDGAWQDKAGISQEECEEAYAAVLLLLAEVKKNIH